MAEVYNYHHLRGYLLTSLADLGPHLNSPLPDAERGNLYMQAIEAFDITVPEAEEDGDRLVSMLWRSRALYYLWAIRLNQATLSAESPEVVPEDLPAEELSLEVIRKHAQRALDDLSAVAAGVESMPLEVLIHQGVLNLWMGDRTAAETALAAAEAQDPNDTRVAELRNLLSGDNPD